MSALSFLRSQLSHARVGVAVTTGAAAVISSGLVWQSSYAAYTGQTSNPAENWATGTVALTDDDSGTALFSASNLKPGSTDTKCIVVTSNGSLPSAVKLYGTGYSTQKALGSSINLSITQGTGGSFGSCTGFTPLGAGSSLYSGTLAAFAPSDFSTGLGTWTPTGTAGETRTFQLTYTVDPSAPNSTQGGSATIGFTWEAQNT